MVAAQNRKKRIAMTRVNLRRTDEGEIIRMVEYNRLMRAVLGQVIIHEQHATYDGASAAYHTVLVKATETIQPAISAVL